MSDDVSATAGSSTSGVAGRYASALFELAKDASAIESTEKELRGLQKAIAAGGDLSDFIKSPAYGAGDQERAISALADKAGYSALTSNFLKLAARNRRLFALNAMISAFGALAADDRGEVTAEAISATPLSDEHARALRQEIETKLGRAVNLKTSADPELLGGLIVKIGSQMIDSSLRTKLNKIKIAMKEA